MRDEVLAYLKSVNLKSFAVSSELPFSNSGTVMYLKNAKKLYVDLDQETTEPFIVVLGGLDQISQTVISVTVYLSTDAKQIPTDYATVMSLLRGAKDLAPEQAFIRRNIDVSTSFENDLMVTEVTFSYTKLS